MFPTYTTTGLQAPLKTANMNEQNSTYLITFHAVRDKHCRHTFSFLTCFDTPGVPSSRILYAEASSVPSNVPMCITK